MNLHVPAFPRVAVTLHPDTSAEVTIQGISHPVPATGDATTTRRAALDVVAQHAAAPLRRTVRVTARDIEGTWDLLVHPDGTVTAHEKSR